MKIARGSYQREIFDWLAREGSVTSPQRHIQGRAKAYLGRYVDSFHALLGRMEQAGYRIERTPGPRGGEWGATYRIAR